MVGGLWAVKDWIQTKRHLLKRIKAQVDDLLGVDMATLQSFQEQYASEFSQGWSPSSQREVVASMLKTRLVLAGDFHAFAQSQRAHLRLLRSLPASVPVVLCLECFLVEHQDVLDLYLRGEISENHFLERVDWQSNWGFPWEHYRPLLQMARNKGFVVKAMNSAAMRHDVDSLAEREALAAKRVSELRQDYPQHLFFILFGDLHLVDQRFPSALRVAHKDAELGVTRVFQNSEELYFALLDQGLETRIEVMKSGEGTFCVLSSPPWVKWQSYLMYLEQTFDVDLEDEDEDDQMDFTDHVHSIAQVLKADFDFEIDDSEFSVYSLDDDLSHLFTGSHHLENEERLLYFIESDRSFVSPAHAVLFLSRFSINHAASLAGMFVHLQQCGVDELNWRVEDQFESWIWLEAVAFFFSKWINHKRKTESLQELKAKLAAMNEASHGRAAMVLAMEQRLREVSFLTSEENMQKASQEIDYPVYFEASKILGSILGEKLYHAVKSGQIEPGEFCVWLKQPMFQADFSNHYYQFVKRIETISVEVKI